MRVPIIAGNWKMYKTIEEAIAIVGELAKNNETEGVEVVVCPPFTALDAVVEVLNETGIAVGAQNMHWVPEGAFTGEVSAEMLKDVGCKYVLLGHSERREYFGETDESVNKKLKAAFDHQLIPILCIGEKLEEREAGMAEKVVQVQLEGALAGISSEQVSQLVIAYEPVWAIGTGRTASDEDAQNIIAFIRKQTANFYSQSVANRVRILYGGSVKPDNITGLMNQPDIDGALVGGASLNPASFLQIIGY